jgi:hypothetical protein
MSKVLIAVPTFESIYPDTFKSIYDLDKGEHELIFDFVRGYDTASARNNIVALAKGYNADYVLMVDSDVVLPKDALSNLISHGENVVLGYYAHRNRANDETPKTCLCKLGEINYTMQYTADELKAMRERGEYLFRIHGGGMGCALIRTSVFDRMPYPYYDWKNYNDANHSLLSEDLYFCEQCRYAGIEIFADSRVSCGHMFRKLKFI